MFFSYLFFFFVVVGFPSQFGERPFTVHALSQQRKKKKKLICSSDALFGSNSCFSDVHRTGACQGLRTQAVFVHHEVATNEYIHYRLTC